MTTPLDIIISRTLTVPPATAMFAYRDNVADVDTGGEYAFAAPTVYVIGGGKLDRVGGLTD